MFPWELRRGGGGGEGEQRGPLLLFVYLYIHKIEELSRIKLRQNYKGII
jgi:hypothetical protein